MSGMDRYKKGKKQDRIPRKCSLRRGETKTKKKTLRPLVRKREPSEPTFAVKGNVSRVTAGGWNHLLIEMGRCRQQQVERQEQTGPRKCLVDGGRTKH